MSIGRFFYGASCILLMATLVVVLGVHQLQAEPDSTPPASESIAFAGTEGGREEEDITEPPDDDLEEDPTPTIVPIEQATSIPPTPTSPPPTPIPTRTQVPPTAEPVAPTSEPGNQVASQPGWSYLDIGHADDGTIVGEGFGGAQAGTGDWTCQLPVEADVASEPDTTWRTMRQDGNSVIYLPATRDAGIELYLCVSRVSPDDTWSLWLGGQRSAGCAGTIWATAPDTTYLGAQVVGPIEIPGDCVSSTRVVLAFTTKGSDEIGIWGVLARQDGDG